MSGEIQSYDSLTQGIADSQNQAKSAMQSIEDKAVAKGQSVLHDLTIPSTGMLLSKIGTSGVQVLKNLGKINPEVDSYTQTFLTSGYSGLAKKAGSDAFDSVANLTRPAPTPFSNVGDAVDDTGTEMADLSTISTDTGTLASNVTASSIPAGAGSASSGSVSALGDSGGLSSAQASLFTQGTSDATTALTDTASTVASTAGSSVEGTMATITAGSSVLDEVPIAGLALTGVLAIGTEIASLFDKSKTEVPPANYTEAGLNVGMDTI